MKLKRVIGKFLVAALLAGGATLAVASPSTAMPRDTCMDWINYSLQEQWLGTLRDNAEDTYIAWLNPLVYLNPLTQLQMWEADTPYGAAYAYDYAGYTNQVQVSHDNAVYANAQLEYFHDHTSVCP